MPLADRLPARWRKLAHEVVKFGLVGGVNTVINYAVFNALVLTVFPNGQLKATVAATVVAATTSYLMNRHWTYRDRPKSTMRREYALFFLFNGTGLAIELGMLAIAKYGFGITSLLAINIIKTGGLVVGTVFRFWAYRTFVFRAGPAGVRPEDHPAVELDPVAELAEVVTEVTGPHAADLDRVGPPGDLIGTPFADPIDAELAAELDAELRATSRRRTR